MGTKLGKLRSRTGKFIPNWRIGRGALKFGQIDVNREQKPRSTDLSGESVAGSPLPGETGPEKAPKAEDGDDKGCAADQVPPWAAPLRDMYQQVVEEPLPDFLSDLLSRLDRDIE